MRVTPSDTESHRRVAPSELSRTPPKGCYSLTRLSVTESHREEMATEGVPSSKVAEGPLSLPLGPEGDDGASAPQSDGPGQNAPVSAESRPGVQPGVQRDAPTGVSPASGAALLARNPLRDQDPQTGRFRPGNLANLKHGAKSRQLAAGSLPELALAIHAKVAALVADAGGEDATGTIRRDLMTTYARLDLVADHLAADIFRHGPLTGRGRTRAATTLYLQVADRLSRLGERLGLDRRAASVRGLSALDYMSTLHHGAQEHEHHDPRDRPADPQRSEPNPGGSA